MNILKLLTTLVLVSIFFNCHNNAHLRTQKLLKKDESVIDISNFDSSGFNSEIGIDKIQKIVMTKTATLSVQSR